MWTLTLGGTVWYWIDDTIFDFSQQQAIESALTDLGNQACLK